MVEWLPAALAESRLDRATHVNKLMRRGVRRVSRKGLWGEGNRGTAVNQQDVNNGPIWRTNGSGCQGYYILLLLVIALVVLIVLLFTQTPSSLFINIHNNL